ncbi:MAG: SgcJ/EcaC family oxidoreductase [Candidatus Acidiferrales bacterium]
MRTTKFLVAMLAVFFLAGRPAMNQRQTTDDHAKDRAATRQTVERFLDAWNTHDPHAFAMTFTEDADFTNVAGMHARGRANVEKFHAPVFATIFKDSHQTAQIRSIRFLTPDLAAVDVDWQMTGATFQDGSPQPSRKGLLNWVMAKQADRSWLIEVMHNTELTDRPAITK